MSHGFKKSGKLLHVKSRSKEPVQFEVEKVMLSSNSASAKKIVLNFPEHLLERTDSAAELLQTDRSKLIREAVEERVRQIEREELSRQRRVAYAALAESALALNREFEDAQMAVLVRTESQ